MLKTLPTTQANQLQTNTISSSNMSLVTQEIRATATEIYHGDEIGQEKTKLLLREVGLPNGLLPLKDIEEVGRVEETGFVWLKQKNKVQHKFEKIGKPVIYDTEITAIADRGSGRIKKLTGVKTKELMVWLTLSEIYVDKPPTGKITFKTPSGLSRTFPVSAFEVEEKEEVKKEEVKEEEKAVPAAPKEAILAVNGGISVKEV